MHAPLFGYTVTSQVERIAPSKVVRESDVPEEGRAVVRFYANEWIIPFLLVGREVAGPFDTEQMAQKWIDKAEKL